MSTSEKNSLLNPVGVAESFGKSLFPTGKTIAVFEASLVPEGTELFVQPSENRLKLEVEVANSNAAHHRKTSVERGERIQKMRSILRDVNFLLHSEGIVATTSAAEEHARKLSELITKELS